jgi:Ca2+-binding EF-hand superfamily protein
MFLQRASISSENTPLTGNDEDKRFRGFLKDAFLKYDLDGNGTIDSEELLLLFRYVSACMHACMGLQSEPGHALSRDLNESITKDHLHSLMDDIDTDRSGSIGEQRLLPTMAVLML